jgi:hypothetical protein
MCQNNEWQCLAAAGPQRDAAPQVLRWYRPAHSHLEKDSERLEISICVDLCGLLCRASRGPMSGASRLKYVSDYLRNVHCHDRPAAATFIYTKAKLRLHYPFMASLPPPSPTTSHKDLPRESDDEDAETASQRSISLSSPSRSRRNSVVSDPRQSFTTQSSGSESHRESNPFMDYSDVEGVEHTVLQETPNSSVAPSIVDEPREFKPVTYPPSPPNRDDAVSITSFASTSSRKARPESLLINPTTEPLVLGVALVDFNHLVRPLFRGFIRILETGSRSDLVSNTRKVIFLNTKK